MLRARIITALVLLPLVLAALYLLPVAWFAVVFWVIVGLAAWEWAQLAGCSTPATRATYVAALAALSAGLWWFPALQPGVLLAGSLFWLFAIVIVLRYPGSGNWLNRPVLAAAGWLALLAAWCGLLAIRGDGSGAHWVLWVMLLVWAADIGAYFAGRRFGSRKLAPAVSPGKTWEGALGGAGLALVVSLAGLLLLGADSLAWLPAIVVLIVVSVFGDLFESVLKRQRGVKDSGALLPGHGGVLDRIDSLLAVLPCFAVLFGRLAGPGGVV